jgi:hypothetical protein
MSSLLAAQVLGMWRQVATGESLESYQDSIDPQSPFGGADYRLRRDSLGLSQIIASTLANLAPAMSFFFGFGVIVGGAGVGAPLTIATLQRR